MLIEKVVKVDKQEEEFINQYAELYDQDKESQVWVESAMHDWE